MLERADKTSRILDVKYFILLPKVSDVGTPVRRHPMAGPAAIGQRAGNVSPAARPDFAGQRGEFLGARSRVPAGRAALPHARERITARDFRHSHGQLLQPGRAPAWANCGPNWRTRRPTTSSPAACTNSSTICKRGSTWSANRSTNHFSQCARSKQLERDDRKKRI